MLSVGKAGFSFGKALLSLGNAWFFSFGKLGFLSGNLDIAKGSRWFPWKTLVVPGFWVLGKTILSVVLCLAKLGSPSEKLGFPQNSFVPLEKLVALWISLVFLWATLVVLSLVPKQVFKASKIAISPGPFLFL